MDDYENLGVRVALQAVQQIVPRRPVHAVGCCLGGTMLAIIAAALGRDGDASLKTLTLLAAQTDFADPGELALSIDRSRRRAARPSSAAGARERYWYARRDRQSLPTRHDPRPTARPD
jgi:poly(3-hydroxyalkanoate) synthetase